MSKVHRLMSTQKLPVSIEDAWSFFSNAHNLLTITPPFLNLKVTNEISGEEVHPGQIIAYKIKPFAGISVSWITEITHLEKHKMFVDEQRKGPYKLWNHQHHFKPIAGGTEMRDAVDYRLPLGVLGEIVHPVVKKKLIDIFTYRYNKINALFGNWPNQKLTITVS